MAAITDLTWQQLQTSLTDMGLVDAISVVNGKVMIDVGIVTGEVVDGMTDTGVVEFLYKIRDAAGRTQVTVNNGIDADEQLTSFPPFSYSSPTEEGLVGVTQVSSFSIPLNLNNVFGTN